MLKALVGRARRQLPLRSIIATARDISASSLHRRLGLRGRAMSSPNSARPSIAAPALTIAVAAIAARSAQGLIGK